MEINQIKNSSLRILHIEKDVSPDCGEIDLQLKNSNVPLFERFREVFQPGEGKRQFQVPFRDLGLLFKGADSEQAEKIEQLLAVKLALMAFGNKMESTFAFDISIKKCTFHRQFLVKLDSVINALNVPEYTVSILRKTT